MYVFTVGNNQNGLKKDTNCRKRSETPMKRSGMVMVTVMERSCKRSGTLNGQGR
jgi:hypothetical protein